MQTDLTRLILILASNDLITRLLIVCPGFGQAEPNRPDAIYFVGAAQWEQHPGF